MYYLQTFLMLILSLSGYLQCPRRKYMIMNRNRLLQSFWLHEIITHAASNEKTRLVNWHLRWVLFQLCCPLTAKNVRCRRYIAPHSMKSHMCLLSKWRSCPWDLDLHCSLRLYAEHDWCIDISIVSLDRKRFPTSL